MRWVLPDVEKSADHEAQRDKSAAQAAEQKTIEQRIEFCRKFHRVNPFQRDNFAQRAIESFYLSVDTKGDEAVPVTQLYSISKSAKKSYKSKDSKHAVDVPTQNEKRRIVLMRRCDWESLVCFQGEW